MNGPWECTNCGDTWGSLEGQNPIMVFCHLCINVNKEILGVNLIWGQCGECGKLSSANVKIAEGGDDREVKVCWKCGYSDYETNIFADEREI